MKKLRQQIRELADENNRLKVGTSSKDLLIKNLREEIERLKESLTQVSDQHSRNLAMIETSKSQLRDRDHRITTLGITVKQQAQIINNLI